MLRDATATRLLAGRPLVFEEIPSACKVAVAVVLEQLYTPCALLVHWFSDSCKASQKDQLVTKLGQKTLAASVAVLGITGRQLALSDHNL